MMASFAEAGAAFWPNVLSTSDLAEIEPLFESMHHDTAGNRLQLASVHRLAAVRKIVARLSTTIGPGARIVRALLLDKKPATNWALGWHQDRVIEVAHRVQVAGFGSWTVKDGRHHVAPPIEILRRMITARLHIDPVGPDNAPLLIAPGSHLLGAIAEKDVPGIVQCQGEAMCLAGRGDVWIYSTPMLHASRRAERPHQRRVLQIDVSADVLPGGLTWASLDGDPAS